MVEEVREGRHHHVVGVVVALAVAWAAIPAIPLFLALADDHLEDWVYWLLFFGILPGVLALWPATILSYWGRRPLLVNLGAAILLSSTGFLMLAGLGGVASRDASEPMLYGSEWYALAGGVSLTWGVAIAMTQYALPRLAASPVPRFGVILVSALAALAAAALSIFTAGFVGYLSDGDLTQFLQLLCGTGVPAGFAVGGLLAVTYAGVATELDRSHDYRP